ncbi:hypothetical protein JQ615_20985 [Bradyrhizobium jicamae]|uniref:Uncharacterized protein n=1 Tax=Bradyrhizobium jicamae TaxID=280332 RepID=A0ABS5FNG2_9BRAD|nr:hypothetical protein [Bradyrhizobium jicamae]MBR0797866.1 hypothetical protein [Bradyrhizobium jicamae]MBR0935939.1 hypothetical protein [Bradyrhizobium jicamae]
MHATDRMAAAPKAARIGTMTIMRRLYLQLSLQTIELLVMQRGDAAQA